MKQLQLRIQVPFSWYREEDRFGGFPLWRAPDPGLVHAYAQALKREIEASGDGMEDVTIAAVRLGGGIAGILPAREIEDLMRTIRRTFSVDKQAETLLTLFPGSLDLNVVNTYRQAGIRRLLFEVPSLVTRECRELGFPETLPALDMTNYILQSMRFAGFGLRVMSGIAGRTEERWENILWQIFHYNPQFLEFYPLKEAVDDKEQYPQLTKRLRAAGYEQAAARRFVRRGFSVLNFEMERDAAEYLGIGLGAESRMDGYYTKNTTDMRTYLAGNGDFERILTDIRTWEETGERG
ncbi:MAG: hypothetical protein HFI39_02645 [Lachnospiraceae bacterium]|nr:hypothetical protein [Lachnospiraceae bacterium]